MEHLGSCPASARPPRWKDLSRYEYKSLQLLQGAVPAVVHSLTPGIPGQLRAAHGAVPAALEPGGDAFEVEDVRTSGRAWWRSSLPSQEVWDVGMAAAPRPRPGATHGQWPGYGSDLHGLFEVAEANRTGLRHPLNYKRQPSNELAGNFGTSEKILHCLRLRPPQE